MKRRDFLRKTASIAALTPAIAACSTDEGTDGGADAGAGAGADGSADSSADATKKTLPTYEYTGTPGPESLFKHGVASGDPLANAVILWTRVTLDDVTGGAPASAELYWEIATDTAFKDRIDAGFAKTGKSQDFTLKVDATGLAPATRYHYRFYFMGRASPVGRTLTAPTKNAERVRFGVCSCARYSAGYYVGYRGLASDETLDAVLHLGDYMYESDGAGGVRPNDPPHRTTTLAHYRRRYARQRTDADLQLLHATHPMIAVWDDHETANNSSKVGASGHNEGKDGTWEDRKKAGMQAWHEWLPIRDLGDFKIWRHLPYGDLCDLVMLDTRLWGRDKLSTANSKTVKKTDRSIMGMDQENWLFDKISASKAKWIVIGQQVMVAPLTFNGAAVNSDQWDGYRASRQRLADAIIKRGTGSTVVLTGDIHSSWASELVTWPTDYKAGSGKAFAVEFVCPGITSGIPAAIGGLFEQAKDSNPHIRWWDLVQRGYIILTVDAAGVQSDWYHYADITDAKTQPKYAMSWRAEHGSTVLKKADKAVV